jgi:hypothetical protein
VVREKGRKKRQEMGGIVVGVKKTVVERSEKGVVEVGMRVRRVTREVGQKRKRGKRGPSVRTARRTREGSRVTRVETALKGRVRRSLRAQETEDREAAEWQHRRPRRSRRERGELVRRKHFKHALVEMSGVRTTPESGNGAHGEAARECNGNDVWFECMRNISTNLWVEEATKEAAESRRCSANSRRATERTSPKEDFPNS